MEKEQAKEAARRRDNPTPEEATESAMEEIIATIEVPQVHWSGAHIYVCAWSSLTADWTSTGYMVANPARGQLNWENGVFPVPVG